MFECKFCLISFSFLIIHKFKSCQVKTQKNENAENEAVVELQTRNIIKFIILDCSMVNRLDEIGINVLKKVILIIKFLGIHEYSFFLYSCMPEVVVIKKKKKKPI